MRRQWDLINQLVQLKYCNCYLVTNSESYLLILHPSKSVHNCTYGKQKTDKAQNIRAKTVYVECICAITALFVLAIDSIVSGKKWSMSLLYLHTTQKA